MPPDQHKYQMAIHDFQSARQRASIQEILARFSGKSTQLLSYDEVAEKLKLRIRTERGVQHIPIDAIVGSVGRDTDFTRAFLPRRAVNQQRWANVKAAMEEGAGLPPIEVYKVGEVYFVMDGNHRVSIAKQEGFTSIEARVIEVRTNVPLTPDVQPDDLIIKAEYAEFLEDTRIMDLRPNVDLSVSIPGQYEKLMSQIYLQKFIMVEDQKLNASLQDAVEAWYDNIYIPLAEAIRDRGLLRWFPDRTITDLYIWIAENRTALEKEQGWAIQSDIAATDLILERSVKSEPGSWRKARTATRYTDHLFMDILVPLSGDTESWDSLEQAILIAQREEARLHGLHIVDSKEKVASAGAQAVQTQFNQICADASVDGKLIIESGDITRKITERATMTDLIVLKIVHPPLGGISTLLSPFRTILANSPRPLLGVPGKATQFKRALLAYDGSERAKEALFVATYLAEMWKTELTVFTALDGASVKPDVQGYVKRYLEIHEVEADYILTEQDSKASLKNAIDERQVDLVLIGTYGRSVIREVVVGSTVDYMLRESNIPVFICR
ncbi:MAG TPA: universal stress protein [Anaerolineales bacterium]|nr:universal stress protein [Anaerolineales bacterium]